jgi:hypothetical protein
MRPASDDLLDLELQGGDAASVKPASAAREDILGRHRLQ